MRDYYNEVDPYAAQHLRNLIAAGEIPAGDVDERDIRDVRPADLDGYRRCHFFAGVGVWARALQEAGWPDDLPVWTGSCPCQPFSAAGKGAGFDDERHLWPDWHWLIEQCRPETVLGEQVASADGLGWADLVSADLEATGYALGPVDTCAAGFRSFHIRQRLYFAAHDLVSAADVRAARAAAIRRFGGMVDTLDARLEGLGGNGADRHEPGRIHAGPHGPTAAAGAVDRLADTPLDGRGEERAHARRSNEGDRAQGRTAGHDTGGSDVRADPSDGYWRDADWLFCRDGVWRPTQPGLKPLAHAAPGRLGRLRAYGNALDLAQATGFCRAYLERDVGGGHAGDLFEWGA